MLLHTGTPRMRASLPETPCRALITYPEQCWLALADFSPLPSATQAHPNPPSLSTADNGVSDQSALLLHQDPDQFIDSVRVAGTVIVTRGEWKVRTHPREK